LAGRKKRSAFIFLADLIRISQRHAEEPLTARFKRDDVLARGEDNPSERHHAFLADRLANHSKRLLADFAVGNGVVSGAEIQCVDFLLRHKLVYFYGSLALNGDGLKLFGLDLDKLSFAYLVALDDIG